MVDDYLDFSRTESPPGKIVRHLEHCASCREYLEKSKSVHIALFRGLNDAYEADRLPDGFADRLASAVAEKRGGVPPGFRLPRWLYVASIAAVVAGFVFAATVAVESAKDGGGEPGLCDSAKNGEATSSVASAGRTVGSAVCFSGSAQYGLDGNSALNRETRERIASASGAASQADETGTGNAAGSGAGVHPGGGSETVTPPPGAASSLATDCIELDARTFTSRATNAMPLRITPRSGLYIIVS
jgi:hypothetical protein